MGFVNNKLDEIIMRYNSGTDMSYSRSIWEILNFYNYQRMNKSINPFDVLLVNNVNFGSQAVADEVLDFLYKNDVKSFIIVDSSSALLGGLILMLNSNKYSLTVKKGCTIKGYGMVGGILVEIKRKHSSSAKALPSNVLS